VKCCRESVDWILSAKDGHAKYGKQPPRKNSGRLFIRKLLSGFRLSGLGMLNRRWLRIRRLLRRHFISLRIRRVIRGRRISTACRRLLRLRRIRKSSRTGLSRISGATFPRLRIGRITARFRSRLRIMRRSGHRRDRRTRNIGHGGRWNL